MMQTFFFILTLVFWCVLSASASHFYGGTIILKPNGSEYSVLLRSYWVGSTCSECSPCTDTADTYGWHSCIESEGTVSTSYSFASNAWGGRWSGAGSWNLFANTFTANRLDNGLYNNPPVTNTIPVFVMQHSCNYEIDLTVFDLDGDNIRCRFATGNECASACNELTEDTLDSNTCRLSYTPPSTLTGYLPVTIQVEDFYDSSSSTALSSIPLQFIVYVHNFGRACDALPEIVTPSHNAVYALYFNSKFQLNVTARSMNTMSKIEVIRPSGMTVSSSITWSAAGYSYMSKTATWTPSSTDERAHVLCFMAIDSQQSAASKPTCVVLVVLLKDCGQIQSNTVISGNATLTSGSTTYLSTASVSCNTGYNTSTAFITCQSHGQWSVATCKIKDCGQILSNTVTSGTAFLTSGTTTYLSTANVSCNTGYNTTATHLTCQSNGQWSVTICMLKDCGNIPSKGVTSGNATLTTESTTYLSTANVSCKTGYNPSPTHITCQSNGQWSEAICTIHDCGRIQSNSVTFGTATLKSGATTYLSTAIVSCNTGYNTSTSHITCQSNGQWSNAVCMLKNCGKILPNSVTFGTATLTSGHTTYLSTANVNCKAGYNTSNTHITCQSNGHWSLAVCTINVLYGGVCEKSGLCLTEGAHCLDEICVCNKTGIVDFTHKLCNTMPLIKYGSIDDKQVPKDVACSGPVTFPARFTVFGKIFKSVYICLNGYISLDKMYTDPNPPSDATTFGDFTILAPYYADTDVNTGSVYYRYYDITQNNGKDMANGDVANIEYFIHTFGGKEGFTAAFILVVTWKDLQPVDSSIGEGTATFQLVLVTDGTDTFALYIYEHGGMKWNSALQKPKVWIGYHSTEEYSKSSLFSLSKQALTVDQKAKTNGVKGVTLHHLNSIDETPIESVVKRIECYRWYNDNVDTNISVANTLPECPCNIRKLSYDHWFSELEDVHDHPDIACSTVITNRSFSPYGKSCCYNKTSTLLVKDRPYAGSFFLYHPSATKEHAAKDIRGKTNCCYDFLLCDKYYELRPIGSCYKDPVFDIGTSWGDPHFRTLDNQDFTFNGLGEFRLMQVAKQGNQFLLQARTSRSQKADGSLSQATVFSAFAAQGGDDAHFHVEINRKKTGFTVYANREDISLAIGQHNYTYESKDGNMLIMTREQDTITVFFPYFDISLNITVNVHMFTLVVLINTEFRGQTRGLLGNFNADPHDDFVLPNGTMRNANMSEKEVFDYGSEWRVDFDTSIFIYAKGRGHDDYHNASYIPLFLQDAPIDKVEEAKHVCSGDTHVQCIFDFVFTEDEEIARQTKASENRSVFDRKEISAKIPTIETCEVTSVYLNDEVLCQLIVGDGDDVVIVEGLDEDRFTVFPNKTLIFKIVNTEPIQLRVTAENSDGNKAPKEIINLFVCTGCNGHGICSSTEVREVEKGTGGFKLAKCVCDVGFDGEDCEKDFDGCASRPCSLIRGCTDMTPSEHKQTNTAYKCGRCPPGYSLTPEGKCVDINECSESNGDCEQNCTNTDGGFECSCKFGYRLNTTHTSFCTDINECDESLHKCQHVCRNTDGTYDCSCKNGFALQADELTCFQNASDVCSGSIIDCSAADGCTVENGEAQCFCNNGFGLTDDKKCEDIDECSRSVCPQDCENTIGSFTCKCYTGYVLSDITTCTGCEFPTWGDNCSESCDCPDAIRCDPVKGCVCRPGLTGIQCDTDIKECLSDVDLCQDIRKTCIDTEGAYVCECINGYQEDGNANCKDIDECSSPLLNECDHICENVNGNYTCECNAGYSKHNQIHCKDIDECNLQSAACDHICDNYEGSFNCYCEIGYILADDRRTCIEDDNPCKSANITCDVCVTDLITQTLSCDCKPGYGLEVDGYTCLDIQECDDPDLNMCREQDISVCVNERGSYRCECPIGYKLQNDMRTLCDEFHYGVNCSEYCNCIKGTCDSERGCTCDEGWLGEGCDQDIDECQSIENVCVGDDFECQNTLGSYKCQCKTGFHDSNGVCQDTDECNTPHTNDCDQLCENTVGSFRCVCHQGFIFRNKTCTDIDECVSHNNCGQKCDNTIGSYRCSCEKGYILALETGKSCTPIIECNDERIKSCNEMNADCVILHRDPICNCWKGFQFNNGKTNCEDINECLEDRCTQKCENKHGGYNCTCNTGFQLDKDYVTCKLCQHYYNGQLCDIGCNCNITNTVACSRTDGICDCKEGWESEDCSLDINECAVDLNKCEGKPNSTCENYPGSYTCNCNAGFDEEDGLCLDIDECQEDIGGCIQDCENIEGGFICNCFDGYNGDGSACTGTGGESICDASANDTKRCEIYESVFGECRPGFECMIENGDPLCKEGVKADETGMIVGVAAAVFVAVVLLIIIVVVCMLMIRENRNVKKREGNQQRNGPSSDFSTAAANEMNNRLDAYDLSGCNSDHNSTRTSLSPSYLPQNTDTTRYYRGETNRYRHRDDHAVRLPRPNLDTFVPRILLEDSNYLRYEDQESTRNNRYYVY